MNKSFNGLDIGKFMFAIAIVALHTGLFLDVSPALYNVLMKYVYTSAVPYFFMCSGFLCEHKLQTCKGINNFLLHSIRHLIKVFSIWGSVYILLSFGRQIIQGGDIIRILENLIHNILILSPGGGMWYVGALIILEILLYFVSKNIENYKTKLTLCLLIFGGLWCIPRFGNIFGLNVFDAIAQIYNKIFISTNNFIFFGVWFFGGIFFYQTKENIDIKKAGIITVITSFAIGMRIGGGVPILNEIIRAIYSYSLMMLFYSVGSLCNFTFSKRMRSMSSIIYFTHMTVVMICEFGFLVFLGSYEGYESGIFVISILILLMYSFFITSSNCLAIAIRSIFY